MTATPSATPPTQEEDPSAAVRAAQALARVAPLLEPASPGLSLAHYRVLAAVEAGDARGSRIAQRLALGRPAISAAVASLVSRGLLARGAADGDQRAVDLALTDEGHATLRAAEGHLAARVQDLCARTPDPGQLLARLGDLGDAVEELRVERARAAGLAQ